MSLFTFNSKRYLVASVGLTVISLLAFILSTEWIVRTQVIPQDNYSFHQNIFFTSSSKNVAFGDSHFSYGVTGVDDVINLSFSGDSVFSIEAKSNIYFKDRTPGRVIIQADPHMFALYREIDTDVNTIGDFDRISSPLLWMAIAPHSELLRRYWTTFLKRGTFESVVELQPDGAQTRIGLWTEREEAERASSVQGRALKHRPAGNPENLASGQAYERLLASLTEKGAQVCMVGMPVIPEYASALSEFDEYREAKRFFTRLASRYGATYVDLWDAIADETLFYDQDHLNHAGAIAFGPVIASNCTEESGA